MPIIWRPKSSLTEEQKKTKLKKDSEYEIAHLSMFADFKAGKIAQTEFETAHTKQWNDYVEWSKVNSLYEEVTVEQQLTEAEDGLNDSVKQVNVLRKELKKPEIEVKEKTEK